MEEMAEVRANKGPQVVRLFHLQGNICGSHVVTKNKQQRGLSFTIHGAGVVPGLSDSPFMSLTVAKLFSPGKSGGPHGGPTRPGDAMLARPAVTRRSHLSCASRCRCVGFQVAEPCPAASPSCLVRTRPADSRVPPTPALRAVAALGQSSQFASERLSARLRSALLCSAHPSPPGPGGDRERERERDWAEGACGRAHLFCSALNHRSHVPRSPMLTCVAHLRPSLSLSVLPAGGPAHQGPGQEVGDR